MIGVHWRRRAVAKFSSKLDLCRGRREPAAAFGARWLSSASTCALSTQRASCAPGPSRAPSAWQIFSKQGVCLYYREWNRPSAPSDIRQDQKLMFGFLFSLKQLVAKMSPKKCVRRPTCTGFPLHAPVCKRIHGLRRGGGFYACSTNTFKLNYYEPPSGLRFILTTDLSAGDMRESLRHIYSNIYVESLSKNPLWKPDEELTCPLFTQTLERYIATIS